MAEPNSKRLPQTGKPPVTVPVSVVAEISEAVASIRHGTVQIIIQDGRVVQIDKTEKLRLI